MANWTGQDIYTLANQNWSRNNKFWVEILFDSSATKIRSYLEPLVSDIKAFNSCIIDVNLYDAVADPIEQYINEEYVIAPGRIGSSQIAIRFRDRNQNELYKIFHSALYGLKRDYPDEIATHFKIYSEPSWNEHSSILLADIPESILTTVSGLTLDNASQNQITEFTVTWKCPRFFVGG